MRKSLLKIEVRLCLFLRQRKNLQYMEVIRSPSLLNIARKAQRLKVSYPSCVIITQHMKLDPNWISGFTDGEGTFYVGIYKNPTMKTGYQVLPEFRIVQHKVDVRVLYAIKKFFSCGVVRVNHDGRYEIRIRNFNCLKNKIVPFFEKYKLHTKKRFDFLKFRKIIMLMDKQEHLNMDGIEKILKIAEKMNTADKTITRRNLDKDKVRSSEKSEA